MLKNVEAVRCVEIEGRPVSCRSLEYRFCSLGPNIHFFLAPA